MDWKLITTAFVTLFLAELGDKTQLAALSLSAKSGKPIPVFLGAAAALVFLTFLAVLVGEAATQNSACHLPPQGRCRTIYPDRDSDALGEDVGCGWASSEAL